MWFGGIGTYIKASQESHAQVGDPANDGLRVERRGSARQGHRRRRQPRRHPGRAASSSRSQGGRINTDFIDNSAGVDCSDNEVNIKIALEAAKRAGQLTEARRVALLEAMTDEVAALVLEDNRLQALALSIAEQGGPRAVGSQTAADRDARGQRQPRPAHRRARRRRRARPPRRPTGTGLTRPELAVLLSSAKLVLQAAIEASDLAGDDEAEALLLSDFPEADARAVPQAHPRAPAAHARSSRRSSPTRSSTAWAWSIRSSWPRRKAPGSTASPRPSSAPAGCSGWTRSGRRSRPPGCPRPRASSCSSAPPRRCAATWPTCCAPAARCRRPSQLIGERRHRRRPSWSTTSTTCSPTRRAAMREAIAADLRRDRRAAEGRGDGRQAVRGRRRDRPGPAWPGHRHRARCG